MLCLKHMRKHNAPARNKQKISLVRMAYRLLMAAAIAVAIGWNLYKHWGVPNFRLGNFFSYFTIQSNLIAFGVLVWAALSRRASPRLDVLRGAATLYMTVTGVTYALLLSKYQLGLTSAWVNAILHQIGPVVVLVDWLYNPPTHRISWRRPLLWLIYPIVWLIYTLIRGPVVHWYPYPFVNPTLPGGYGRVGLYVVGIALSAALLGQILALLANQLRGRQHR